MDFVSSHERSSNNIMAMTLSSLETWQAISRLVTCCLKLMATSEASVQLMLALDIIGVSFSRRLSLSLDYLTIIIYVGNISMCSVFCIENSGTSKFPRHLWAISETPKTRNFAMLSLYHRKGIVEFWNTDMIWNRMLWVKLCNQYCRYYVEVCCMNYIIFIFVAIF